MVNDRFKPEVGLAEQTAERAAPRLPVSIWAYLRLLTEFDLCCVVGPSMLTKRPYNWSPGLGVGALCTAVRARPVGTGLGAKFGRKPAKRPNKNHKLHYLSEAKVSIGYCRHSGRICLVPRNGLRLRLRV